MIMVKVKVSVTIESELVNWMDGLVERGLFRNRSHFVEESVTYLKGMGIKRFLMEKLEG